MLYIKSGEYFGRKLLNINTLLDYKSELEAIKELILPEELVVVSGNIIGFTMKYIKNNINLQTFLNDFNNSLEDKIKYIKEIGRLLDKIEKIEKFPYQLHLGDLHEANFIIDEKGELKAIDTDSYYISNNRPFPSKYLYLCPHLSNFPHKYIPYDKDLTLPNKNSDIFCYIIIILNTLANTNMYEIPINEFYNYLNYLESLETPKSFLYAVEKIYNGGENENPLPYIDELPIKKLYMANKLVYKKRTGIDLTRY